MHLCTGPGGFEQPVFSSSPVVAPLIKIDHSFIATAAARSKTVRFCSRCGEPGASPPRGEATFTQVRVCEICGMGMLLTCLREALPGAGAAFVIATAELRVSAVSESAEGLFGTEQHLLGSPLTEILTSPMGDSGFSRVVARAALRNCEPEILPVLGVGEAARVAGMLAARVSTCGAPRAALVTVEPSAFGRG